MTEPCVCALEKKYEGVNGANSLDLLSEGDSVLAIPPFGVAGPRSVDDRDAGVGRISQVVANYPRCLCSEGLWTMAYSKPREYFNIFPCDFISSPSANLGETRGLVIEEPETIENDTFIFYDLICCEPVAKCAFSNSIRSKKNYPWVRQGVVFRFRTSTCL